MVEQYTPKSASERKSNRLTPVDFVREQFVPKWGTLIAGAVGGWFLGGAIGGKLGAERGRSLGQYSGSVIGGVVLGFLNWRKKAASEFDSAELAETMRDVLPMAMTTDEVKGEIAHTRDLLAYEQRQNASLKALLEKGPSASHQPPENTAAEIAPAR